MIYPHNLEQKLGFDKVRELLARKCLGPLGEEQVSEMAFSTDPTRIAEQLDRTSELLSILNSDKEFPLSHIFDLRPALKRIRPEGAHLDEKELFDLKRTLVTAGDIARFLCNTDNETSQYPALSALVRDLPLFPGIITEIDNILDKAGNIKDNASPTLQSIRREIAATTGSISRTLQSILRAAQTDGLVDKDVAPSIRDGRLMIPIAPAHKRRIKGIVHDESASGKTVFIEPEAVVEANNKIRELEGEEKREIIRILVKTTDLIRPHIPQIQQTYAIIAQIDFIRAKAIIAQQLDAIRPSLNPDPRIDWINARHPLLYLSHQSQGKETIPLDITLHPSQRILIISGPNAGGKSVCLKTVGLLQYMLQCGMLIPLGDRSQTGIFHSIFIDIGDEQSIENDLSTYSSHLINMKHFDKRADNQTLILIDEFGSGTEPQIGGAIAEALLQRFNDKQCYGLITTHYQNLKLLADKIPSLVNGAMLYDRHQMTPLFQLSIGHPGSSFAIEIARKIGLPPEVIDTASQIVGEDYVNMDKYLSDITRDKRYWETKREAVKQQEKKINTLVDQYHADLQALADQRKALISQAKEEAAQILNQANAQIENAIRQIKESQADKEQTKLARQAIDNFKATIATVGESDEKINQKIERLRQKQNRKNNRPSSTTATDNAPIAPGDHVRIKGQPTPATVIELLGDEARIAFGAIKSIVKLSKLEKISAAQIKKQAKTSTLSSQSTDGIREKTINFKPEIDVRGMRADEARQAVSYYIDDAILTGVTPVRILHGTGHGILRQIIRDYLRTTAGIASYHDEDVRFGGVGITVVELE